MNYNEAIAYINDTNKFGSRLGLTSISKLMDILGNPQDELKITMWLELMVRGLLPLT